jgi:hypothetical protein
MTIPVLSTGHVSGATMESLGNAGVQCTTVATYMQGAFIMVPDAELCMGAPDDLLAVFDWARKHGYDWVRLDADGDTIEELPSYAWE